MISVIISWPDSFDFPLFRNNMPELLEHVDEVIICFTQHGNHPLRKWLRANIPGVVFLDVEDKGDKYGDWRNQSTNYMIDASVGDWILSLEQDFFINNYPHFFNTIKKAMENNDVIIYNEGNRFHPACMFVKKDVLKKTKRDFSVMGQGRDHFSEVSKELKGMKINIATLESLDLLEHRDWSHMRGLTDNYFAPKPYAGLEEFKKYNDLCKEVTPMNDYWKKEMERCDEI